MSFLSKGSLENNLLIKTLNARNPFDRVFDTSGGYTVLTQISNMIGGESIQVGTEKYEFAVSGNQSIFAKVDSTSLSGNRLTVNYTDSGYNLFRVGDTVMDSERKQGMVVDKADGRIVLEPMYGITWDTTVHFKTGMVAKKIANASANRGSTGIESLTSTPDLDYNYWSVMRDTLELSETDFIDTYVKKKGKIWAHDQQGVMLNRFAKDLEMRRIFHERDSRVINGKKTNFNGGMIWSVQNRGGHYEPSSNALQEEQFRNILKQVRRKRANGIIKLLMLGGTEATNDLQTFVTNGWLKYVGSNNTFGNFKGLNVKTYAILDVEIEFIRLPLFDDDMFSADISEITGQPRMSSSFFLLDLSPIPVEGGGTRPAIEKFHFGKKEMKYTYTPGLIGADGGDPSDVEQNGSLMTVTDTDSVTFTAFTRSGINIADAKGMAYFELTR